MGQRWDRDGNWDRVGTWDRERARAPWGPHRAGLPLSLSPGETGLTFSIGQVQQGGGRAVPQENTQHPLQPGRGRQMQNGVSAAVQQPGVRPCSQQCLHHGFLLREHCQVKGRLGVGGQASKPHSTELPYPPPRHRDSDLFSCLPPAPISHP